ncbi:hypothetical protein [Neptuniibacter sp.]|uniref:hypothetical protein n=1 Tax=Neptuniibacter sp. TaxID=1962643 RepID=UPI002610B7CE|nr:hypothetical protein [Neptuniibacter sp.]MCP4597020.1 hypothetical protein [Neptuniibacter sp.]
MNFLVEFNIDNDAFKISPEEETAKLLRLVGERVLQGEVVGRIRDTNGNTVGEFEFID